MGIALLSLICNVMKSVIGFELELLGSSDNSVVEIFLDIRGKPGL